VRVYQLLFRDKNVKPNLLTLVGLLFGFLCFILTVNNWLLPAGLALFVSGFFDLLDGAVARHYGRVTAYGGFLDSVLDRYTDLAVAFGIFLHFLNDGDLSFAILTFAAATGVVLVSYIRARAEAASLGCKSGLLERPERTILLIIGLCFNEACSSLAGIGLLKPVIILLVVLAHLTAVQRILIVRKAARG
jgi:CDP-diacylglycerol--glycerol-3-phosphate 3-phosphatidyltransferase